MNGILERIQELEKVLARATEAEGEVGERKAALAAKQAQADQIMRELQERIEKGESTGDPALDIKIILRNSVAKDKIYDRLSWLQNLIEENPGELVLVVGTSFMRWTLAVLPAEPALHWEQTYRRSLVKIPVVASCTGSGRAWREPPNMPEPIVITLQTIETYEIDKPPSERKGFPGDLQIVVGMEAIQAKAQEMRIHDAFWIWVSARILGKPIELYPELALEIRNRRERRIVELIEAMGGLKDLQDRLAKCQAEPAEGLKCYGPAHKVTVTPTPEGVTIDFGLMEPIEAATERLRELVESAFVELEMGDNPTLQEAAKMLDMELEKENQS